MGLSNHLVIDSRAAREVAQNEPSSVSTHEATVVFRNLLLLLFHIITAHRQTCEGGRRKGKKYALSHYDK